MDPVPANQRILRPNDKRSKMQKRLPVGRGVAFKLPLVGDPKLKAKFEDRTVKLINPKRFRNIGKGKEDDDFIGTLKVF